MTKHTAKDSPFGHEFGGVTDELIAIEDGSLWAANLPGVLAVLAHVEEAAVIGVHVALVVELLAVGVDLGAVGAGEAVGENICGGRGKTRRCNEWGRSRDKKV